jgi:pyruvate,water dikinase
MGDSAPYVRWLSDLGSGDTGLVGGKNASLGEMISSLGAAGIRVPGGFATTAEAYWAFVDANDLRQRLTDKLGELKNDGSNLAEIGDAVRGMIAGADFPDDLAEAIRKHYGEMREAAGREDLDVAVRSSATAEDLPEASFAGQLETFLNIRGDDALLDACKQCYASLFTDRAISYRTEHGFDHMKVALSVGVQRMVRADTGGSGVMFSIDTETGFPGAVLINANWGLGETVVQGMAEPDEFHVFKPLLDDESLMPIVEKSLGSKKVKMIYGEGGSSETVDTDEEERHRFVLEDGDVVRLGRWARAIEEHYRKPMDMEWAKDGETGELFVVQARPETVQSQKAGGSFQSYKLKETGEKLAAGLAVGDSIAAGKVCRLSSPDEIDRFEEGAVLVTGMTDPDWVPIMKQAAAIVTDEGGRTSHAAIVSRELQLTAVVGTGNATGALQDGQEVTVSCAESDEGVIYKGTLDFEVEEIDLSEIPETETKVMVNLGNPAAAYRWWRLPADGVGLARMEFVIGNMIKAHPLALLHFDELEDEDAKRQIAELTRAYPGKAEYFVERLAQGLARVAAVYHPEPVIVRMSDFKTNEYAELIGGAPFEPAENNPMLGWRGASRYYEGAYREGFALECRAIKKAREEIGLTNLVVMIPFCRTLEEADRVIETMAEAGLRRGEDGLEIYVMCEIPSNVILAAEFAERFDGFSIGSNDLTQLVLGVDRDNDRLSHLFDERNDAVTRFIARLIADARQAGAKTGLCGQAPSDHPDFAGFLVREGIHSISVTPDSFLNVKRRVAEAEKGRSAEAA